MDEVKNEIVAEPKKEVAVEPKRSVADWSLGIYGSADNFELAQRMAMGLSKSTIVPIHYQNNPSNCLIALEQALRLDISPMLVMQNSHVIQGKLSWSSSFLIGMINGSGRFDKELQYEETQKDGKPFSCLVWTEKDGRRVEGMTIDMDMANAEGWTKKNGSKWLTMPQLMLRYRAASFFARLNCPELTLGLYTKEEMLDNDFGTEKSSKKSKATLNSILADEPTDDVIDVVEVVADDV